MRKKPRILVVTLNFPPELTGIGKYTGEMTEHLAASGFEVRVVTAPPYYPRWKIVPGYSGTTYRTERLAGATVTRCPLFVPARPGAAKRVAHLLSFALSSLPVIFWLALRWRPQAIFVVEPPIACAPAVWLAGRMVGARLWLHVQDFEVDAAFDLGLLRRGVLQRAALAVEAWLMRRFDRVSTISGRMLEKLRDRKISSAAMHYFPNWVDTCQIHPGERNNALRQELAIPVTSFVLLYSGNMGEKQGLDVIVRAAEQLLQDESILILLCGDGAARSRIERDVAGLPRVRFIPLQPLDRLNELLALADVHLLPQRADAEDLVLPSKLTAMMASGRPVVATASPDSEVGKVAAHGGLVVASDDVQALIAAIRLLLADTPLRARLGASGREYAAAQWDRRTVLDGAAAELRAVVAQN